MITVLNSCFEFAPTIDQESNQTGGSDGEAEGEALMTTCFIKR